MSDILLICHRDVHRTWFPSSWITEVATRLTAPNIVANTPDIIETDTLQCILFNPVNSVRRHRGGAYLGSLLNSVDDWAQIGGPAPDGSYALFRWDHKQVEVLTDIVASRSIWCVLTEDVFMASTSQRALICALGDYQPNPIAVGWMLATGCLGAAQSWDRRLLRLPGDTCCRLCHESWRMDIETTPIRFTPSEISQNESIELTDQVLESVVSNLDFDTAHWRLLLSGGYDSRLIFSKLHTRPHLQTLTWGLSSKESDRTTDQYIARSLAQKYHVSHHTHFLDRVTPTGDEILRRFVLVSEGASDMAGGYVDGLAVWKWLFESGAEGIIRGDHGFGWKSFRDPSEIFPRIGIFSLDDVFTESELAHFELISNTIPENLFQRPEETMAQWRDRLKQEYRLPMVMAPLNNLKGRYVEVINPLLMHPLIRLVRRLPDSLRSDKLQIDTLAHRFDPTIESAQRKSLEGLFNRNQAILTLAAQRRLEQTGTNSPLSDIFVDYLLMKATSKNAVAQMNTRWSKVLTKAQKKLNLKSKSPLPDTQKLILRSAIIVEIDSVFREDVKHVLLPRNAFVN